MTWHCSGRVTTFLDHALLIESTASWRLAEITLSLAQAERFAWALGTRLSGMLAEVEREVKTSGDRQSEVVEDSDVAALHVDDCRSLFQCLKHHGRCSLGTAAKRSGR